ncbi:MAG TPA: class I SAM-dependent methyltransferase [Candidatus Limnocylindrales bacterium]|nr:class I SAM-dependent methyltransferase [Candidatus Limnocylindrales bacterium]
MREFLPLPESFRASYERYGWPYEDAETLNVPAYACPLCGASDRDRLYALYLADRLARRGSGRTTVLDIAPSEPLRRMLGRLAAGPGGELIHRTADIACTDVDERIDITDMRGYADASIDVFICSHVLEHVGDDRAALRELYRVLAPGGWGILMVPILLTLPAIDEDPTVTDVGERWHRFGQDDHVRGYSKAGFVARIREAGFTVAPLGRDHFGAATFTRCAITAPRRLYVDQKRA